MQSLSCSSDIVVPVFEELDRFWIEKFYKDELDPIEEVARVLKERVYGRPHDYGWRNMIRGHDDPDKAVSVGFKWRPHGRLGRLPAVLRREKVKVFVLCRRDLLEICSSYYVSQTLAKDPSVPDIHGVHTQFALSGLADGPREELARTIRDYRAPLNPFAFYKLMCKRILQVGRLRAISLYLKACGVETEVVHFEDFKANPDVFIRNFRASIGLSEPDMTTPVASAPKRILKPAVKNSHSERVKNYAVIRLSPLTWMLCGLYSLVVRKGAKPVQPKGHILSSREMLEQENFK